LKEIVVLQKVPEKSLNKFGKTLKSICSGLEIRFTDIYNVSNGWVKVDVDGDDETAAVNLIAKEMGVAPVSTNNVTLFSVHRGRIIPSTENEDNLFVDIGVFSPDSTYAVVPLKALQGQLVDGKKHSFGKIQKLFGLIGDVPVEIQIVGI